MLTIVRYTFKRSLGQILGWGVTLGLITAYLMVLYKPILEQQTEYKLIFDAYGDTMLAFFGGAIDFVSPAGYLNFVFFSYIPIVAGIFAILIGSGLLAADEERGTLDLILAHPISRTAFFWGRFAAFCGVTGPILLLTWAGFAIGLPFSGMDINVLTLILPHISLFAILVLFGVLALLLSLVMPSRTLAASVSAALMVVSYLVNSLANINENLEVFNNILPLKYYQGGLALNGLDGSNLLVLLGSALLFVFLAWLLFLQRDIRVSGEGSWRLEVLGRKSRSSR
jgi:ABC-2 type transport system permease protein